MKSSFLFTGELCRGCLTSRRFALVPFVDVVVLRVLCAPLTAAFFWNTTNTKGYKAPDEESCFPCRLSDIPLPIAALYLHRIT
jgi:hypothetical protein